MFEEVLSCRPGLYKHVKTKQVLSFYVSSYVIRELPSIEGQDISLQIN